MTNQEIKSRTIELYDQLPQDEVLREMRTDIRDQILELNLPFFHWVASTTFINSPYASFQDKSQSAICHWLSRPDPKRPSVWAWYKLASRYRTDLSFAVFYRPRLGEMLEREFNEVKYSLRRDMCMLVGAQIGKHWGQVRYEDLSNPLVHLPAEKMNSLKAMFGSLYFADLAEHEMFLESDIEDNSLEKFSSDQYDSVEELLIHEMILEEKQLTASDLVNLADVYSIPLHTLEIALPRSLERLHTRLLFEKENH